MVIKKGEAPKTFPAKLSFAGPEKFKIDVTYVNRRTSELQDLMANDAKSNAQFLVAVINDWDADYPLSVEGMEALEDERPGAVEGLILGFWKSRRSELEKN